MKRNTSNKTKGQLEAQLEELRFQLAEANDTIEAIRTGQIDALVVQSNQGHQLYTLKSADQAYRIFIEKMTEGAVTLNPDGTIVYCNSQFANMVDMSLSAVLGLPFELFIADENRLTYRQNFVKSWDSDCKTELLLKTGKEHRPVQLSLNTLELDEGTSLSIILTDLSVQKNTQRQLELYNEQLEQANRALEVSNHDLQQFASVASHDLQEPLRKIQIFSDLIKESQHLLTPAINNYVAKILESSARMRTLIIDILNYSRLSASIQWEYTDLNLLLKELLSDFELVIRDKEAEIIIADLPFVDVNRGQMRQVFQNIISNALKFCRPQIPPKITIGYKRISTKSFHSPEDTEGPYCLISIKDNGIGFDEKYLSSVFSLFERLHTKDKYEGTGIGLAIAKKIIDKHNGLIDATSQEQKGAAFRIVLPIAQKNQTLL